MRYNIECVNCEHEFLGLSETFSEIILTSYVSSATSEGNDIAIIQFSDDMESEIDEILDQMDSVISYR